MPSVEARGISVVELAEALRSVDPRAVLVPPRILRRVIRGVLRIDRLMGHVPHRGGFATSSTSALLYAEPEELNLELGQPVPDRLILLAEPALDRVESLAREQVILRYWRSLFHARVHLAFDERPNLLPPFGSWLQERIKRLGSIEFAEARAVLIEDSYLVLPADDRSTYVEFAAVYLELFAFHPPVLPHMFPAIADRDAVLAILAEDVDFEALLEATRLPGSPASRIASDGTETSECEADDEPEALESAGPSPGRALRLRRAADASSARGNNVRAAIVRSQAARLLQGRDAARERSAARGEIEALARRLRAVVGADATEAGRWKRALTPLLDAAACGHWSRAARLLYDLQKVCLDRERPISAIDLVGWITSAGRRPLRRPMLDQREVMVLKHLHALRWPEPARGELERLVACAIDRQSAAIRDRFRPRIRQILDCVSLRPHNAPERVASRKLVEELLDLIAARGFLRIGDLRDAISRNALKLSDLSGPSEFFRGDPLLRADDELARALDGVYHRGEVYLRGLQRASSLAFGTKVGRWLTRFLALPFGGAFLVLEGLQHIVGPIVQATTGAHIHLFNPTTHLALGLLLLGVVNFRRFRGAFTRVCRRFGRAVRTAFVDAPAWLLRRPVVRWVINSRTFLFAWNWVAKPFLLVLLMLLLVAAMVPERWAQQQYFGLEPELWRALFLSTWLVLSVVANSRSGRAFEEIAADGASRLGQRLWRDLIPNAFRATMDFFNAVLEAIERILYGVDEWLRFRGGDGRIRLASKAMLGLAWAVVAYLARIYVNLLIEPQVNPIKHFPVVTVSHKIILPMSLTLIGIAKAPLVPIVGAGLATTFATTTVFLLPGVFGFLAWELKENWRLYAANRSATLRPVAFGHHGETMSRLLRRGFHSGTLPKLFARLRKAERRAERGRGAGPAHKRLEQVHHVAGAVRQFVERGVIYTLEESRALASMRPTVGEVDCGTNRISVALRQGDDDASAALIAFEESDRRLRIRLVEAGWLTGLDDEGRRVMASALAGLCAMSDADLVIEPGTGEPLDARCLCPAWASWVASWEGDAEGRGHRMVVPDADRLLPAPGVTEPSSGR
jgi:hypothetical protein